MEMRWDDLFRHGHNVLRFGKANIHNGNDALSVPCLFDFGGVEVVQDVGDKGGGDDGVLNLQEKCIRSFSS
jgi:hypothetical protein